MEETDNTWKIGRTNHKQKQLINLKLDQNNRVMQESWQQIKKTTQKQEKQNNKPEVEEYHMTD